MMRRRLALAGLVISMAVLAGCGNSELIGEVTPNSPPDTRVTSTPPVLSQTTFKVDFFWIGSDKDGWVDRFEWRISDNGDDGRVDVGDTLGLPWNETFATDSTFVVSADIDSFEIDVSDPNQTELNYRFWQTHTFFIRAIDNLGARDLTPATVSFTATTIAPTVRIETPKAPNLNTCVDAARALKFVWVSRDPDDVVGDPAFVRYALVDLEDLDPAIYEGLPFDPPDPAQNQCLLQTQYNQLNPVSHFKPQDWSPWIPFTAAEDSGTTVIFPLKDVGQRFFFAVQAMDVAGAVTPTFEWERNMRHVRISTGKKPGLSVTEKFLGRENFVGENQIKVFDIVAGQPLDFSWQADATDYAGVIEAYRYGWEIQDPLDAEDEGWAVPWGDGPSFLRAPLRTFNQGNPNFVVQCRDNSGTVSRGTYQFQVIQITPRAQQKDLLLIDDWGFGRTDAENAIAADWKNRWLDMLQGRVSNFNPKTDYVFARDEKLRVKFRTINDYKSVLWFLNGASGNTQYAQVLQPASSVSLRYNWLEVYQAKVGNLMFVGPNAMIATIEPKGSVGGWITPIIFNSTATGQEGFGSCTAPDGSEFACGTTRWPYTGWCLEAVDYTRPPTGLIWEETAGSKKRDYACDYLIKAKVNDAFLADYPSAFGFVDSLVMNDNRRPDRLKGNAPNPSYRIQWEEFYNSNVSGRDVSLNLRSCQVPMFLHVARRDDFWPPGSNPPAGVSVGDRFVARPDSLCAPTGRQRSTLDKVPVGIVSTVYSDVKQLPDSEDFLWGFHPLAFRSVQVQSALLWIIKERWQIDVR